MKNILFFSFVFCLQFSFAILQGWAFTSGQEKFNAACDIRSMRVKGVSFKVQDTYYKPKENIHTAIVAVKNLTVSGKLPVGTVFNPADIRITTASKNTEVAFFINRRCIAVLSGVYTVCPGENLLFVRVKDKQTGDYQVYTISIVGVGDPKADDVYAKYPEPTVVVSDIYTLRVALETAKPGQVIGIAKGDYYVFKEGNRTKRVELNNKHNVIVRSVSGKYEDVNLYGSGFHKKNKDGQENVAGAYQEAVPHNEMFIIGDGSSDITLYGITIRESNANGYKINGTNERNITLDHCRALNVNEYMVKGSGPSNDMFVYNLKIVNCHFENTMIPYHLPQSDHTIQWGDYVGAIDIMNTRGSYIAGNTMINILGADAGDGDRHQCFGAIGFWGQGGHEDAIVERNFIYNCGTGIMLGIQPETLSSGRPALNRGIVRNNIIFTSGGWDGIASAVTVDVQILNNTIVKGYDPHRMDRGIRDVGGKKNPSKGLVIKNNFANNFMLFDNPNTVTENNLVKTEYYAPDYFVRLPPATLDELQLRNYYYAHHVKPEDFMLTEKAVQAIGRGVALPHLVEEDFFGVTRGSAPDIGAVQYRPTAAARTDDVYKGHDKSRLRGAMIGTGVDEADIRVLGGEWGANHIRWQLLWNGFPNGPADTASIPSYRNWLEGEYKRLERLLPVCEELGMLIVIDLHTPPGGRERNSTMPLFRRKELQDEFIHTWETIAKRFKGNKAVWAYDLLNETVEGAIGEGLMNWKELCAVTAQRIRAIDPERAIIIEPAEWAIPQSLNNFKPLEGINNLVYSVHVYLPHSFTHQEINDVRTPLVYPGEVRGQYWDKEILRNALEPIYKFQREHKVHIYLGEFSALRWSPDNSAYRYIKDCIEIFEENGWDWAYHAYREFHGWSVEHDDNRSNTQRTKTPTNRQALLMKYFQMGRK